MKKRNARVLAILLAGAMLAGCGSGSGSTSTSGSQGGSTAEPSTQAQGTTAVEQETKTESGYQTANGLYLDGLETVKLGKGEYTKFDETVKLTFGKVLDPNSTAYVSMAENGEPYDNTRWHQLYRENLNIECEYTLINANQADYTQQLTLAMTSNSLPDVFLVYDQALVTQLAEAGAIWDLTEVWQDNANQTLVDVLEGEGSDIYSYSIVNNKLYGIPVKMPSTNSYNHLWVRRDWLEQLNLEVPTTMEEVKTVAQAFKDNIDGAAGGIMMHTNFSMEMGGVFWAYGGQNNRARNQWVEGEDGKLIFAEVQDTMKGGYQWLSEMYQADLFNADWSSITFQDAMANYIATGEIGMMYGPHWYGFYLQNYEKAGTMGEGADWIEIGLPTGSVDTVMIPASNTTDGCICISSACQNPEAVIQILNIYAETLFGENNDFDNYFACSYNSGLWDSSPIHVLSATVDLDPCNIMIEAWNEEEKTCDVDKLYGTGVTYWTYIQEGLSAYQYMFGPVDSCFAYVYKTYPQNMKWNKYLGAPTTTKVERGASLQELIDTYGIKMITGEIPVDTGFDEMVEQWYSLGGTQLTEEVNAAYAALQSR